MARERDEAKRQAILAAAKRLFAGRGFKGTSLSELARAETDPPRLLDAEGAPVADVADEEDHLVLPGDQGRHYAPSQIPECSRDETLATAFLPSAINERSFINILIAVIR